MTEADKEIIEILKELFRNKSNELVDPDDQLREQIVKWTIYSAIICAVVAAIVKTFGNSGGGYINGVLSGVIGIAFTLLFIYLNLKTQASYCMC